jgi:hypothetical protein
MAIILDGDPAEWIKSLPVSRKTGQRKGYARWTSVFFQGTRIVPTLIIGTEADFQVKKQIRRRRRSTPSKNEDVGQSELR